MKNLTKTIFMGVALSFLSACNDFEKLNINPFGVTAEQVQPEYFINNSIVGAQQDPHIAERIFVLYWTGAAHFSPGGGISVGTHNDGWSVDYYGRGFLAGWLSAINGAITIAETQLANGTQVPYTANLIQVARIWRAHLLSEAADTFGPIPINGYQGEIPIYSSVQDVYNYVLDELADASGKLDVALDASSIARFDPAYGYDFARWQRFANSLRMRLAMRLSEVDQAKAKSTFEAAASGPFISTETETFKVAEEPGWSGLTGDFTRSWNHFNLSATLNNIYVGLGGVGSSTQLSALYSSRIKPADYLGVRYQNHFATMTNQPTAGYWFDGLPNVIDPRAYKIYAIPGDVTAADYPTYATLVTKRNLLQEQGDGVFKEIDVAFTWNGFANGVWGPKGTRNQVYSYAGSTPRLNNKFRNSDNDRISFGPWESYFLIAEAAVRGWTVPMSGKAAYELGIDRSFAYWGVTDHAGTYKSSTSYNNNGTSVSWDHTTEPPAVRAMDYVDGYTGTASTVNLPYPTNNLYEDGTVRNDLLTKIITQKFVALVPWSPLEAWSDHRRLGLPFFENPAVELSVANIPDLNQNNYMTSSVKFFPQRITYPSSIRNTNPAGYSTAVNLLGGQDNNLTPLWWAKKTN